jgi:hypothetical protein
MGRPGARGSPFVWANLGVISFDRKNSLSDLKQYSADVNVQTMDVNVGHQARGYPPTHPENKGLTAVNIYLTHKTFDSRIAASDS